MTDKRLKEIKDSINFQYDFYKTRKMKSNIFLKEEQELYNEVIRLREIIKKQEKNERDGNSFAKKFMEYIKR